MIKEYWLNFCILALLLQNLVAYVMLHTVFSFVVGAFCILFLFGMAMLKVEIDFDNQDLETLRSIRNGDFEPEQAAEMIKNLNMNSRLQR